MLDALPADGELALSCMAQFTANMLISVRKVSVTDYVKDVLRHYESYGGKLDYDPFN